MPNYLQKYITSWRYLLSEGVYFVYIFINYAIEGDKSATAPLHLVILKHSDRLQVRNGIPLPPSFQFYQWDCRVKTKFKIFIHC